jgi:predicted DNA-binding transcriptional regulator AlpA
MRQTRFAPNRPQFFLVFRRACWASLLPGGIPHREKLSMCSHSGQRGKADPKPVPHIRLSRWINEPYPPLTELLSAHDVARLTRRPRWLLVGLELIGRFPRKARFRGRALGWWRSDVLEWMARDLALARHQTTLSRPCLRRQPRQPCLPLESGGRSSGIRMDSPRHVCEE